MPLHRSRPGASRVLARAFVTLALAASTACGGDVVLGLRTGTPGTGGGSGSPDRAPELIGRWTHTVIFNTMNSVQSSETVWEFRADGGAIRTVTILDLTSGVGDVITSVGTWQTSGGVVTITFLPPDFGSVSFGFQLSAGGGILTLGGTVFQRA